MDFDSKVIGLGISKSTPKGPKKPAMVVRVSPRLPPRPPRDSEKGPENLSENLSENLPPRMPRKTLGRKTKTTVVCGNFVEVFVEVLAEVSGALSGALIAPGRAARLNRDPARWI